MGERAQAEVAERVGHTPGPWRLRSNPYDDGKPYFHIDGGKGFWGGPGFSIAGIVPEADARLIAAAPDMLAALREVEAFLDDRADVDDGRPNDAMRHLVEVRAAIAKAEGTDHGLHLRAVDDAAVRAAIAKAEGR